MSDQVASFIGPQRNWILPRIPPTRREPQEVQSGIVGQDFSTVSPSSPVPERLYDLKTGMYIHVLNVPKNPKSIDQTEGILSEFAPKLDEEGIEPADLVKRAWKTSE